MYTLDTYDVIAENERKMMDEYLKLESVHPIDIINNKQEVLHEAVISKLKIKKTLEAVINALRVARKKFKDITRQLKLKNEEWLAQAERFDLGKADFSNFQEEIFPYWLAIPQKFNITIPKFTMDDQSLYEGDSGEFMRKYFAGIVDANGDINKNILRGLSDNSKKEKFPVEHARAKSVYPELLRVIKDIYRLREKVANDVAMIEKTVQNIMNTNDIINESVLLEHSMFKDEYFDILLEALTPDQVEKEMDAKNGEDKKLNISAEDNAKSATVNKQYKLVLAWSKMCSSVTSAEMDILDEAYGECVKFISKVMKSK